MRRIETSPLEVALRFVGTEEAEGRESNPWILAWLRDVMPWASSDEEAWCSAYAYAPAGRTLGLGTAPRTPRARDWLGAGIGVPLEDAQPGSDVVVFKRGGANQPGPEVRLAPGHVAFYMGVDAAGASGEFHAGWPSASNRFWRFLFSDVSNLLGYVSAVAGSVGTSGPGRATVTAGRLHVRSCRVFRSLRPARSTLRFGRRAAGFK
jgi:hypothetical protein